ncbi:leucine-rich repeat domain-containing protein [Bacteroides sp.]
MKDSTNFAIKIHSILLLSLLLLPHASIFAENFELYDVYQSIIAEEQNCAKAIASSNAKYEETKFEVNGIAYQVSENDITSVEVTAKSGSKYQGNIDIPAKVQFGEKEFNVTTIKRKAFYGGWQSSNQANITLPHSITIIEDSAFFNNEIKINNLPDKLISVGNNAFSYCNLLDINSLPETLVHMGEGAFTHCRLDNLHTLPSLITTIEKWTFCQAVIKNFVLPESLTTIKAHAFESCLLESIAIPAKLANIEDSAFFSCSFLKDFTVAKNNSNFSTIDGVLFNKIQNTLILYPIGKEVEIYTIPQTVTTIGNLAFAETKIHNITLPTSLKAIGNYAFLKCKELENIILPNSLSTIGDGVFMDCMNLSNITLPEKIPTINKLAFAHCIKLKDIEIPSSVTTIGEAAFERSGIINLQLPEGIISIKDGAFSGASICKVALPSTLTTISNIAFDNNSSLKSVYCKATTPPECIGQNFYIIPNEATLYVPVGTKKAYETANGWSNFHNIIESEPTGTENEELFPCIVSTEGNNLTIQCSQPTEVTVYKSSGEQLYQSIIFGKKAITANPGIYIVKVGDKTQKIAMQ